MQQPEGFHDGTNRVCRLNKAIYSLKQSPRVWYRTLSQFLIELGFDPVGANHSVFTNSRIFVTVYVDDLLIIGPDKAKIQELKNLLLAQFSMVDLGPVAYYLGMSITQDRKNRILRISQRSYLEEGIRTARL
jgi:hypothetical protein